MTFKSLLRYIIGKGNLITFFALTHNPDRPEIRKLLDEYFTGELAADHSEITAKVFHLKQKPLQNGMLKCHIFGQIVEKGYII